MNTTQALDSSPPRTLSLPHNSETSGAQQQPGGERKASPGRGDAPRTDTRSATPTFAPPNESWLPDAQTTRTKADTRRHRRCALLRERKRKRKGGMSAVGRERVSE
ncbi:hypothetical protein E2C01_014338 [Portunus trituberculatus]|uniref:Uncharacterized protein n=1 Tax=Portunus trituberculatus TaxID=210409 RepID=A0A5B7DJM4_PORTR|nr:hypothetical protein [Portunus trituberculatus]